MKRSCSKFLLLAPVFALAAAGCAHAPAAPVTTQASAAPAPAPAPIVQAAPSTGTDEDARALAQLLAGAVAHFEFDKDQLTPEAQGKLRQIAEALRAHPTAHVRISGHADELGTEEYNLALGQRRAEVAKRYLVALGVDARRLETLSYGEERPADPGHDAKAWATNRRDELEPLQKL